MNQNLSVVFDNDDYFATTASPHPVWGTVGEPAKEEDDVDDVVRASLQESRSDRRHFAAPLTGLTKGQRRLRHSDCSAT
uniref:Uncharacterized protein n=1 Tax=Zea mays TaxID=4577 RepID=A0A804MT48_MAIZE